MYIDKFIDAIRSCRFCFMCRHLSGVGNVTFTEADTPRIRASLIWGAMQHPENWECPDFIDTLYRSDLSAACRRNCVNHFDENGLCLAARADIVQKDLAPDYVKKLAGEFQARKAWTREGEGEVIYLADAFSIEAGTDKVFAELMAKAGKSFIQISGGALGKALKVLGFPDDAKAQAEEFAAFVNQIQANKIVVSNPAAYDALVNDFKEFGVTLNAKVMHTSEYLLSLPFALKQAAGEVYYLESDFLRNYNLDYPFPHQLLAAVKAVNKPFGTNDEESYTCGEGAILLPRIDAELVSELAKYIEERADHADTDLIVTASPYTKLQLQAYTKLHVVTLEELALRAF